MQINFTLKTEWNFIGWIHARNSCDTPSAAPRSKVIARYANLLVGSYLNFVSIITDTMSLGDMLHLSDTEWSRDPPGLRVERPTCVSSFYVLVILERRDAVVPALIGKQRECDNEQPLGYAKNSRLHILLFPPLPHFFHISFD